MFFDFARRLGVESEPAMTILNLYQVTLLLLLFYMLFFFSSVCFAQEEHFTFQNITISRDFADMRYHLHKYLTAVSPSEQKTLISQMSDERELLREQFS